MAETIEDEMTMGDHWRAIMELVETLKEQVNDLEDSLRDFNKSAL